MPDPHADERRGHINCRSRDTGRYRKPNGARPCARRHAPTPADLLTATADALQIQLQGDTETPSVPPTVTEESVVQVVLSETPTEISVA